MTNLPINMVVCLDRLGPRKLPKYNIVDLSDNLLLVDIELAQQTQGVAHFSNFILEVME